MTFPCKGNPTQDEIDRQDTGEPNNIEMTPEVRKVIHDYVTNWHETRSQHAMAREAKKGRKKVVSKNPPTFFKALPGLIFWAIVIGIIVWWFCF